MTSQEQINVFERFTAAQKKVFSAKGDDYAGQQDRLSSFKLVGAICGISPELVALVHVATKVVRLSTLFRSDGPPKNEPIDDSILDMGNYTFLLQCIKDEERLSFQKESQVQVIDKGVEVRCIIDSSTQFEDGIKYGDILIVEEINNTFIRFHGKRYLHKLKNFEAVGAAPVNI